jgi:methylthioribose-1-phosphate isomerase
VWNPAFDVTPANLISGIITEKVCITSRIISIRFVFTLVF